MMDVRSSSGLSFYALRAPPRGTYQTYSLRGKTGNSEISCKCHGSNEDPVHEMAKQR